MSAAAADPTSRDPARLDATMADQLACMLAPTLGPAAADGAVYLRTTQAAPGPRQLSTWFPFMPSEDASGAAEGLLLGLLAMDVAEAAYVNSPTALAADAVAALLPGSPAHGAMPAGGALLFRGKVTLGAFAAPFQALTGLGPLSITMAGMVDFSSGFPMLSLTAPLDPPFAGHLAEASITLSSPLYPMAGDAGIRLAGTVPVTPSTKLLMEADILVGGPILARVTMDRMPPDLVPGGAMPGMPALALDDTAALTLRIGRNGGWFTLDAIALTASVAGWELVAGLVTLDQATLELEVLDPTGDRQVMASVAATATFGGRLALTGSGSYPAGLFTLALAEAATLGDIIGAVGVHDDHLDGLAVSTCQVSIDRVAGTMLAEVAVAGSWTLGPFSLSSLAVRVRYPTRVGISGQFTLGGVGFAAAAEYAEGKWTLEAAAVIGPEGLSLGPLFGLLGLPAPGLLDEIALEVCTLSRDPAGGVSASLAGRLAIGPGIGIRLDVVPGTVTGELRIGDLALDVTVMGETVSAALASAAAGHGVDLRIGELAARFGIAVPGGIDATLRDCTMRLDYAAVG